MEPKYSRKSITNSISEKEALESIDNAINSGQNSKCSRLSKNIRSNWHKYVYTFCILFSYLTYGLVVNFVPAALNDLKYMFQTSMAGINYMNTISSIGYLTGALAGFLYKFINRQLFLALNLFILGIFVALIPNCQELWQGLISQFLAAMGGGVWDAGNSVWTIELWGKDASFFLQMSQMCYGLGVTLSPVLVKNFLYGDLDRTKSSTTTLPTSLSTFNPYYTTEMLTTTEDINYSVDRRSKLRVPFTAGGAIALLGPLIIFLMFFIRKYRSPVISQGNDKNDNIVVTGPLTDRSPLEQSPTTRKWLILLFALMLNSYSSFEVVYFGTAPTYLQYLPHVVISPEEAATIMMVLSITYTLGRFVSAFISTKLKPETMLTYHLAVIVIALIILYIGQNSTTTTLVYVGNGILGFGFSAMWPATFTIAENYVKLTDKITAIFSFASAFFSFISPFIIGPLLEKHPQVFLFIEIGYLASVLVIFGIIMIIIKRSQRFPVTYSITE